MSRDYRGILAALAGLAALFIAFGMGAYVTGLNYPEQERYQPYRYAADQPAQIEPATAGQASAQPFQYRTPCEQPKGHEESDLCAQWKAANAAEDSAIWTKWGFWIGVIGSGLLLWQIILTRRAVEDTGDATHAMREANIIANAALGSERAWVCPKAPSVVNFIDGVVDGLPVSNGLVFSIEWVNFGRSPAVQMGVAIARDILENGHVIDSFPLTELRGRTHGGILGPGHPVNTRHVFLNDEQSRRFRAREITVKLKSMVVYRDVFRGVERVSMCTILAEHMGGTRRDDKQGSRDEALNFQQVEENYIT